MLSKFLNLAARCPPSKNHFKKAVPPPLLYNWQKAAPQINSVRVMSHLIPPSQYDMPWPKRMKFFYVVVNYWETIPLFACTAFALLILFISIYNACANKVLYELLLLLLLYYFIMLLYIQKDPYVQQRVIIY